MSKSTIVALALALIAALATLGYLAIAMANIAYRWLFT